MPIYAYKCSSCGHERDVLQRVSDTPLNVCPSCGTASFSKQLTAAGFQLKGSGWYATDFKNGTARPAEAKPDAKPAEAKGESGGAKPSAEPAAKATAPTAAPACGSGGCGACS